MSENSPRVAVSVKVRVILRCSSGRLTQIIHYCDDFVENIGVVATPFSFLFLGVLFNIYHDFESHF